MFAWRLMMDLNNYLTEKDFIQIPNNWCATDFYKISFEGWREITFEFDNPALLEMMHMAARTLDSFIRMYKDERVFTEPEISWKLDGTFCLKIGTFAKEEYERKMFAKEEYERKMFAKEE